jgi:hypothetical protein
VLDRHCGVTYTHWLLSAYLLQAIHNVSGGGLKSTNKNTHMDASLVPLVNSITSLSKDLLVLMCVLLIRASPGTELTLSKLKQVSPRPANFLIC